jgi:hypothetical protein
MIIKINRCSNGAFMEIDEEDSESCVQKLAYEFDEDDGKLEGARSLIYRILDELGQTGSSHMRARLDLRIVHGDDYECEDPDNCQICKENKLNENRRMD